MAVQLFNDMPDAEVHRGDPVEQFLRDLNPPRASSHRAGFIAITVGLHLAAGVALWQAKYREDVKNEPAPIEAALLDTPTQSEETSPQYSPPAVNMIYSLTAPEEVAIETDAISADLDPVAPAASSGTSSGSGSAPLVASVEYIRSAPPVYPRESQRRHEAGTVILRVLVDAMGRPAQIQIEHSSGFERLDAAARAAVEKFLFRPYEVNGVAQPAQVLIPIGFDRSAS
jgi:periplasmic protein TonB